MRGWLLVEVLFSQYFTKSGLVLPENKDSVLLKGVVLAHGVLKKMDVTAGDLVVFSSRAMLCRTGQWIDERHALIHEENLVSGLTEDAHVTN
jgi:co-chaperonin GroES (HSP10)